MRDEARHSHAKMVKKQRLNSVVRGLSRVVVGSLCWAGLACRPTETPVPVEWHSVSASPPAETTLLVMLPGKRSRADEFVREGFIAALKPGDGIDAVTVDLHLGYYRERILDDRLREDVIAPALAKGYRRIEILGISLGGLGGLIYAFERPGEIARLTLLAPYVGDAPIHAEIAAAGGLAAWEHGEVDDSDFQRRLWTELKAWLPGEKGRQGPEIRIGVGDRDRHREANEFFSRELLAGRIVTQPGGHDWKCWLKLYQDFFQLTPPTQ